LLRDAAESLQCEANGFVSSRVAVLPELRQRHNHPARSEVRLNLLLRLPYELVAHAAGLAGHVMPGGGGKLSRSLRGRVGATQRLVAWAAAHRDRSRPLLWMHAPSVGEGHMARPVIDALRARVAGLQVVYTYFSPSAEGFAAATGADVADYLPFDTAGAGSRLIDALAPSALVFSKLDVWPNLVSAAVRRGIPVALTSATVDARSGRSSWLASLVLRGAYAALRSVGAVDATSASRLEALGVPADRVTVTGDVRYDQAWTRARSSQLDPAVAALLSTERPTLVAGSTWPADEAQLHNAWRGVLPAVPRARLVIAAHEPSARHSAAVIAWAAGAGLTAATLGAAGADTDVVIVDRVGMLADIYACATAAYVGGGFHDTGLHSLVEPAAHAVPVIFGPMGADVRDAASLVAAGGGFVARGAIELEALLRTLLGDRTARDRAAAGAARVIREGLGAAERSAALVQALL
jgi:3-deoxy-D-manno-octulosonic-acid transferase